MKPARLTPGRDISAAGLRCVLVAEGNALTGLRFTVATYGTTPRGTARIRLLTAHGGTVIRELSLDLENLRDNAEASVSFESVADSRNQRFLVEIRASVTSGRFTLYESGGSPFLISRIARRVLGGRRLHQAFAPVYAGTSP